MGRTGTAVTDSDYPTIRHLATRTGNHLAAECTDIVAELDRLRIVETTAQAFVDALATSLAGAPWPSATPKPPPGPATCSSSAPTATSSRARSGD